MAKKCPTVTTQENPGWYDEDGNLITSSGINPSTGVAWTGEELVSAASTGAPSTTYGLEAWPENFPTTTEEYNAIRPTSEYQKLISSSGVNPITGTPSAGAAATTPGAFGANIPAPAVTPAPAFEISPEQKAWEEQIGGYISETLEMGGRGIPEETQALMTQKTTDILKAKETEDIRVMRNNMERRGITNSGFVFSNEQKIRSNTTVALANSITDLNIQNSLMKLSSFETTMGQAAQFLGYLGEMSQLKYQPEFATWQAEQLTKMQAWQAQIDIQKMAINQAYQQQNIKLTGELQSQLSEQQHGYDIELAEMELEAKQKAAAAEGAGNIMGTASGAIISLIKPS